MWFILREVHRPRWFKNRVLRKILGLKRKAVIGYWRKLHNEEHNGFLSSSSIWIIKSGGICVCMRENNNI